MQPSQVSTIPMFEPLLDLKHAAQLLQLHPDTLKKKAQRGEVPGVKIGRSWRFRASGLDSWVSFRLSYRPAQVTPR